MIVAVTGHRPDKLGGYSENASKKLVRFASSALEFWKEDIEIITGMSLGWDQAIAHSCALLGIPFVAAIPFKGQESRWPDGGQYRYHRLLEFACDTKIICEGVFSPEKMQIRNEWMVDNSDCLLALYDGSNGGTRNCVKYAEGKTEIVNVWNEWERFE